MNWPKIQRDETNTKIVNKEEVINYINSCFDLTFLKNYQAQLKNQTKVSFVEIEPLINATNMRIQNIESFLNQYNAFKDDSNLLSKFYEDNISFINDIITIYSNQEEKNELDRNTMKVLIDFLKFSVDREKNNEINPTNTQLAFERFYNTVKSIKYNEYTELINGIYEAHKAILNKVDDSAMEYKEKDYKTLTLTNRENNGYKLTSDDENITKLNSAAFITTAIVLQATLVMGLIISLFALVK